MINIVLYQPEICPNTGNIIRLCYATNAKLHIIKPTAFEMHPKWFKRYAAGRVLSDIPHNIYSSYKKFLLRNKEGQKFYISRYGLKSYTQVSFKKAMEIDKEIFFIFGRESTGIPLQILKKNLKNVLRIPISQNCRSLNLANSVAIILFECLRQLNFKNLSKYEVQKGKFWILKNH